MALWGGRFSEPTDADLKALNDSIQFDKRLYKQDIAGSIVYAGSIARAGIITDDEANAIVSGLHMVLAEFDTNNFELKAEDEDIHSAVERRLIELIGDVGGKLHTGRSRNDQVATDFRLWIMHSIKNIDGLIAALQIALLELAEQHIETLMPGYTHLQPAQPITAAHWLMSFFWMLARDRSRLKESLDRTAVCPLGSGGLAGTPFSIDRNQLAKELGFRDITQNSLDGVSDRDFAAELLFVLALMATHLSRFAEDIVIYSNPQFGYITLNDRYSTGSSIMPQKRNADPMELTRGKTGRMIGTLAGFLATLKGLPSTYNKDLQEDKEAVFDTVDTILVLMPVICAIVRTLKFNPDKMREALGEELLATDLADYLVRKGMPFRQAHYVIGQTVRLSQDQNINLSDISLDALKVLSDLFSEDVTSVFDFSASVKRRNAPGGTAPDAVRTQIAAAKNWLDIH